MATLKEIINIVFAEPFRPFRIKMVGGKSYDIRHPEAVQVGKSDLAVYTPLLDDEQGEDGRPWKQLPLMLLESVEPLEAKSATESR